MPGRMTVAHRRQPLRWERLAASSRAPGDPLGPAMTPNRMSHWVPGSLSAPNPLFPFNPYRTNITPESGMGKYEPTLLNCTKLYDRGRNARVRMKRASIQDDGSVADAVCSNLNLSAQATTGRNSNWS